MEDRSLRVWWIPQVPGKPFHVPVENTDEAKKILDVLAKYDLFQLENNIKPDYSNVGGLEVYNEEEKCWEEWCNEEGDSIDDLIQYDRVMGDS